MYLKSSWLLHGLNAAPHVPAERRCRDRPASTWGSPNLSLLGHREEARLSATCRTGAQRWLIFVKQAGKS